MTETGPGRGSTRWPLQLLHRDETAWNVCASAAMLQGHRLSTSETAQGRIRTGNLSVASPPSQPLRTTTVIMM